MVFDGKPLPSPPGVFEKLVRETSGTTTTGYMLTSKNQWRTHFNGDGTLDYIADATVATDSSNRPLNRVQCIYSDGSEGQPPSGLLWEVVDAAGRTLTLGYRADSQLSTITDPVGRVWTLLYEQLYEDQCEGNPCLGWQNGDPCKNGSGYFAGLQDPACHPPITWGYTEDNDIYWISDKNYDGYLFEYDEGRLVYVTDPLSLLQSFAWSGTLYNETICRYTDRRGSERQYWFSTNQTANGHSFFMGNLKKTVDPLGDTTQYEYEDLRNPSGSGPTNYSSNWYLPHRHEATKRINPLGKEWNYTYWPGSATVYSDPSLRGNLATATDPLQHTWAIYYDGWYNNVIEVTQPDANGDISTTIAYNATTIDRTLPTSATLPEDQFGNTATISLEYWNDETSAVPYHALGKLKKVTDANGVITTFHYDSRGQLTGTIEGIGRKTACEGDEIPGVEPRGARAICRQLRFRSYHAVRRGKRELHRAGNCVSCNEAGDRIRLVRLSGRYRLRLPVGQ